MLDRLSSPVFVVLWASGYLVGALAVDVASPPTVLSARFVLALLVALPLALRVRGWREQPLGRIAVIGLLMQGVQFAGIYGGLGLGVPAAISALVMLGLTPLAVTAITALAGLESPGRGTWLALAAGVAGVALSVAPELGGASIGAGVGLTFVGMLGLAGGTVLQKHWTPGVDLRVSAAFQIAPVAAITLPVTAVVGVRYDASAQLGLSVAWLAWPLSIGALGLLNAMLARRDASAVAALLLVVPAVTAILAVPVLGEQLHLVSLAGMAVTLAAVASVLRASAPPRWPAGRRTATAS